jgi:hypothetical protein
MKNAVVRMIMVATIAAVAGVATASAQNMTANVPFKFRAATAYLPAGSYTVSSVAQAYGKIYSLRNNDTHQSVLVTVRNTVASGSGQDPRLMFTCYSENCTLSQVWTPDAGFQLTAPHNKADGERTASLRIVTVKAD